MRFIKFLIGQDYTLTDIREVVGDPGKGGKWVKGYLMHNNEMFIFANIGGGGYIGHDYQNKWRDKKNKVLDWKGDKQSSKSDKYIKNILSGDYPIHLFTREDEYKPGAPYRYQGQAVTARVISDKPVNLILDAGAVSSFINKDEKIPHENELLNEKDIYHKVEKSMPKRSSTLRDAVLRENNYTCEIDPYHITFTSNATNKQYMETHHIIPLSTQKYFKEVKLDTKSNIACLCPNCHRMIHYGKKDEKLRIIKILYSNHAELMKKVNIPIKSIDDIMIYYTSQSVQ